MRTIQRLHSSILIAVFAVPFNLARGCSCIEATQKDAIRYAAVVFRGLAVNVQHLRIGDGVITEEMNPPSSDDNTLVTFEVTSYWKGSLKGIVKVYAMARPSMCDGYKFEQGREYIVYASQLDPKWPALNRFVHGAIVYEVPNCPLRVVRDNLRREELLLGRGRAVK